MARSKWGHPLSSFGELVVDGLEVVLELPVSDVVAELVALLDGVAEGEAEPDPRVDDLLLDGVNAVEVLARGEGGAAVLAARHVDVDVLGVQRGGEGAGEARREAAVL